MRWVRAQIAYRRGDLPGAEVAARAAYEYKLATRAVDVLAVGVAVLLDVLIERGEPAEAERVMAEAGTDACTLELGTGTWLFERRGRLRRVQGRLDDAVADLRAAGDELLARGLGSPAFVSWRADLALALAGLGDTTAARAVAAENLDRSRHCAGAWGLGIALRTVGMLDGPAGLATMHADVLAPSPYRLEHARSLVELGAAVRRNGSRAQARELLGEGMDRAHRLGATALARQAREELKATGARPRKTVLVGAAALTAREHQVTGLAAAGLTNREIAQRLFVTERTVESHLLAGFAKLGVNRRTALTPQLLGHAATAAVPG